MARCILPTTRKKRRYGRPRQSKSGQKARGRATGLGDASHYRRPSSGGNSRVRGERLPGPHRHDSRAGDHQPQRACCPAGGAATCQPERHHATSRAGGAAAAINRNKWRQPDHSRPRSAGLRCWTDSHATRDADGCSSASPAVGSARSAAAFAWSSAKQLLLAFFVPSGASGFAQAPTAGGGRCRRCARRQRRFTRLLDCPRESWPRTSAAERPG